MTGELPPGDGPDPERRNPLQPPSERSSVTPSGSASSSGAPELRPMRVGEILDGAIKLYRQHWKTLMGIAAFILVPFAFIEQVAVWSAVRPWEPVDPFDPNAGSIVGLGLTFFALQILLIQPFLAGAYSRAASEAYLGRTPEIGPTYRVALPLIPAILWVTILQFIAIGLGFIALVIPGIFLFVRLMFSQPIVVIEGARGTSALKRSWELAKGQFWKILGTVILAGIIASIVSAIIQLPLSAVATNMGSSGWVVAAVSSSIGSVVSAPFQITVTVLLYFDMRIRKEAFDLAVMADEITRRGGA